MAKLIAVTDVVYERLKKMKGKRSFSSEIEELMERAPVDIKSYFGIWKDREDINKIKKEIAAERRKFGSSRG
ncbi:MAG: antitoxin [Candidatus Micrarchaeota archaeon]|nr:antitoxin [Candidatus Micrarchaeota archaeon]